MSASIPDKAFYTAARRAAGLFEVSSDDVFGDSVLSSNGRRHAVCHARVVCVVALIKVFPHVRRAKILDGLYWDATQKDMATRIHQAKHAGWWDERYVDAVADAIIRGLVYQSDDAGIVRRHEASNSPDYCVPVRDVSEKLAVRCVWRKWHPVRIILAQYSRRPRNITASFLGDPEPGRRELVASMQSPFYSAANESGRFNRGGGRRPRNDF